MRTTNKNVKLDKTRLDFGKIIEKKYASELMKVVEGNEWIGSFDYKKDNGFAYLNVDNNIGFKCESVLRDEEKINPQVRHFKSIGFSGYLYLSKIRLAQLVNQT